MKKLQLHKLLKVALLISIYCLGIVVPVKIAPVLNAQKVEQNTKQEYSSNIFKVPYVHTQGAEMLLLEGTEYLSYNFNLFYKGIWVSLYSSELLFKNKYKQYQNYFKTLLIRNRKSDLIFPFHNFW
ncbi:hypothetical protein MKD41_06540 [Lutibacter sp. A64]|uniref:hypothetical protein n=1 Tax=Lutibacter sp. A64 TaxID=2918526 RepID=UPI001F067F6B|nr:hypothetical protein [Lutibacter sp. A64]UMB55129.1 hypothetical protein MKD41_06540 [Lutibacter sp. A64]